MRRTPIRLRSVTVTTSTISNNLAPTGGGIENDAAMPGGSMSVTASTISNNTATYNGDRIYNGGTMTVSNSTVTGDVANKDEGGGISNDNGAITVSNSTLSATRGPPSATSTLPAARP
jgi:hypothetical protein